MGGYRVQGRDDAAAHALTLAAKAISAAGCFAVVIEGVPERVGAAITESLDVPTIGIGAGPDCDGQVLVFHDLLGFSATVPKFVRRYAQLEEAASRRAWPPTRPTSVRGPFPPTPRSTTEFRPGRPVRERGGLPVGWCGCRGHLSVAAQFRPAPRPWGSGAMVPDPEGGEPHVRPYEAMVIFDTGADEAAVNGVLDRGVEALKAKGGNVGRVERWGRRTFAYELQHKREGYYVDHRAHGGAAGRGRHGAGLRPGRRGAAPQGRCGFPTRWPGGVPQLPRRRQAARRADMANGNVVTLVGNITRDPELRFTNTGQATSSFGLAVNRRWQNRQTQEWEEATSFFDIVCWREMAENAAESLSRGSRVIVTGRLEQRSWETPDGDKRSKVEVVADEIGPSIRWATAQVTKNERRGPGEGWARVPASSGGGSGGPGRRDPRRLSPRDTDTARSLSSHGTQQRSWRHHPACSEGHRPTDQEEALRPVQGPGGVGRLQGRRDAPQVHERPRQDPGPPGVGQLHPAPARRGHCHQDGP